MKKLISFIVVFLFIVPAHAILKKDQKLAEFSLKTIDEKEEINITRYQEKKNVLLTIFAPWCEPSKKLLTVLAKYYEEYSKKGFEFIAISNEDAQKIQKEISKLNIEFPVLLDSKEVTKKLHAKFFPTTLIVNKEGKIVFYKYGELSEKEIKMMMDESLANKPVSLKSEIESDDDDEYDIEEMKVAIPPHTLFIGVSLQSREQYYDDEEEDDEEEDDEEFGVEITRVYSDAPAEKAGIKEGDIILEIDGEEITIVQDVINIIRTSDEDKAIKLIIKRDDRKMGLLVTPITFPEEKEEND